jgi:hypothetical protein
MYNYTICPICGEIKRGLSFCDSCRESIHTELERNFLFTLNDENFCLEDLKKLSSFYKQFVEKLSLNTHERIEAFQFYALKRNKYLFPKIVEKFNYYTTQDLSVIEYDESLEEITTTSIDFLLKNQFEYVDNIIKQRKNYDKQKIKNKFPFIFLEERIELNVKFVLICLLLRRIIIFLEDDFYSNRNICQKDILIVFIYKFFIRLKKDYDNFSFYELVDKFKLFSKNKEYSKTILDLIATDDIDLYGCLLDIFKSGIFDVHVKFEPEYAAKYFEEILKSFSSEIDGLNLNMRLVETSNLGIVFPKLLKKMNDFKL